MYSQTYARRNALWSQSRGSYIQTSLGSKESIETDEEGDTSSVSGISVQSTKSWKSFKSWRRAQRQKRRNLKRAMTEDNVLKDSTVEALDLSGNWGTVTDMMKNKTPSKGEKLSAPVGINTDGTGVDTAQALQTIEQSPLEPYYSSSPLTSSSSDSDDPSTPPRSLRLSQSEIDEIEDQENLHRIRQTHSKTKDLLKRRSYPFIIPTRSSVTEGEQKGPQQLTPPVISFPVIERRRASADEVKGLNVISSLGSPQNENRPSLLELSQVKTKMISSPPEPPHETMQQGEREVVYTETNGFTISMPAHSPTVPAHVLTGEYQQIPAQTTYDVTITEDVERERKQQAAERSKKKREEWKKKTSSQESFEREPDNNEAKKLLRQQQAFETDPGMYFLPPLIAKAIQNQASVEADEVEAQVHSYNEINARLASISSSTQEESADENVYLENADDIFLDLQEKEFLGKAKKAMPESDTSSIDTKDSIDPIEDILTREDDSPADHRTFTMNGRAVVMHPPYREELVDHESIESTPVSKIQHSPVCAEPPVIMVEGKVLHRPIRLVETMEQEPYPEPERLDSHELESQHVGVIHTHKVGKGKNCPVCKKREQERKEKEAEMASGGLLMAEEVVAAETTSLQGAIPKSNPKPRYLSVYSHKVGDDKKCEVCKPDGDVGSAVPDLCCTIL